MDTKHHIQGDEELEDGHPSVHFKGGKNSENHSADKEDWGSDDKEESSVPRHCARATYDEELTPPQSHSSTTHYIDDDSDDDDDDGNNKDDDDDDVVDHPLPTLPSIRTSARKSQFKRSSNSMVPHKGETSTTTNKEQMVVYEANDGRAK
jgi:hypothetical protein